MMKIEFMKEFEKVRELYSNPELDDFLDSGDECSLACFKRAFIVAKISGWNPVLITGPNGTGKSGYAKLLWNESEVKIKGISSEIKKDSNGQKIMDSRLMVALNCAAIPENLIDSELFGYEKGAFTGAVNKNEGKILFAARENHCLFLDEIGDLCLSAQAKLLRFFQQQEIQPVGGAVYRLSDNEKLKVICATNKDLDKEVREGRFREDLLNRIRKYRVEIPSLYKRPNDCATNFVNFFNSFKKEQKKNHDGVEPSWVNELKLVDIEEFKKKNMESGYRWSGNFRELQSRLNDAIVQKLIDSKNGAILNGTICFEDLFPEGIEGSLKNDLDDGPNSKWLEKYRLPDITKPLPKFDLEKTLELIRRDYIAEAKSQCKNKTSAAVLLGYGSYQKMDRKG